MSIVEVTVADGVAEVLLNRPERKNALSEEMFEAISTAGETLRADASVRAVIVHGAGGDFCSGLDMAFMGQMAARMDEVRAKLLTQPAGQRGNWFQRPATVWADVPAPVFAAIEGVCLGGGIQIALGCDLRIAAPDARLSIMEANWGLIPDMGISQSLPRLMPADRAKLLMLRAEMLSGEAALADGLVTEVAADPLARARDLAAEIAARSPDATRGIKRLVEDTWTLPPGAGLAREAEIQAPIIGAPNQVEAVMANMQKRAPSFV